MRPLSAVFTLASLALFAWATACGSGTEACPSSGACPSGCGIVTMREVDAIARCQRAVADPPCADAAPRPTVTGCCAKVTGGVYAVVGFPSCALDGFRACTAEENALVIDTASAGCT